MQFNDKTLTMSDLNILEIRKSLRMTQQEFGELIGVDKRTIINYEQGKKIPSTKIKILELMMSSGALVPLKGKNETLVHGIKNTVGNVDDLRLEIVGLKDHIKTLKELLDMYKSENAMLKKRIE